MSFPAHTLRSISSSSAKRQLTTKPSTFLPFLYQTLTIQQRRGIRPPLDSSDDPISFSTSTEDTIDEPPQLDDRLPSSRDRPSTITGTERKAFEKLFASTSAKNAEAPNKPLEDVFTNVLRSTNLSKPRRTKALDIASSVESLLPASRPLALTPSEDASRLQKIKDAQVAQHTRIAALLAAAKTDTELWATLNAEVFTPVRKLELDRQPLAKKAKKRRAKKPAASESVHGEASSITTAAAAGDSNGEAALETTAAVIGQNFPSFLLLALRTLRAQFPTSSLPLSLLPSLKRLGRGAYVLGASTALYNELLLIAWIRYADLQLLEEMIQDMDNGGVDFDANTLEILEAVAREGTEARGMEYGHVVQAVWGLDRFVGGAARLERWKGVVSERLVQDAVREGAVREREIFSERLA